MSRGMREVAGEVGQGKERDKGREGIGSGRWSGGEEGFYTADGMNSTPPSGVLVRILGPSTGG